MVIYFIDGIGHPDEPFVLLPLDTIIPFFQSIIGNVIIVGLSILLIIAIITNLKNYINRRKDQGSKLFAILSQETRTIMIVVGLVVGLVGLSSLMPFGSWANMTRKQVWTTGIWGNARYGDGFSSSWTIDLSIGLILFVAIVYQYVPMITRILLLITYGVFLFVILAINPNLGATEVD